MNDKEHFPLLFELMCGLLSIPSSDATYKSLHYHVISIHFNDIFLWWMWLNLWVWFVGVVSHVLGNTTVLRALATNAFPNKSNL